METLIGAWAQYLGIYTPIETERIEESVVEENGTLGHELVGVVQGVDKAIIYHTRPLQLEDIVHELLHVKCQSYTEDDVNLLTSSLVKNLPAYPHMVKTDVLPGNNVDCKHPIWDQQTCGGDIIVECLECSEIHYYETERSENDKDSNRKRNLRTFV